MSIALTEEHQELARVARAFLDSNDARGESRALLEAPSDRLPSFWKQMAELGWMGLHVDEAHGGQGFGLSELSIVLEALGFAMAPGPFLPTTLAAALCLALVSHSRVNSKRRYVSLFVSCVMMTLISDSHSS